MFKSVYFKLVVVVCAIICTGISSARAEPVAADPSQDVLGLVPANCLFCLRVNNFDYALWTADQFLTGVSPIPMGLAMMGRMQLAKIVGDPNLSGINTQGNFLIFGLAGVKPGQAKAKPDIFIAALIAVSDHGRFVSGNPNCSSADANGISRLGSKMLVMRTGSYALVSTPDNYKDMLDFAGSTSPRLAAVLDEAEKTAAAKNPFWGYGNIEQVSKVFGSVVSAQFDQIKTTMSAMPQPGGPQAAMFMNVYFDVLKSLMNETKAVSIALKPSANLCNLSCTISARPGTEMAKTLASSSVSKAENKLLGYLDDGAIMNVADKVNKPLDRQIYEKVLDLFGPLMGDKFTEADKTKTKALIGKAVGSLGDATAFSYSPEPDSKPPFAFKYVIQVKDADTLRKCMDEGAEMFNAGVFADLYKAMGAKATLALKHNTATYKGVSIDTAEFTMECIDPNSAQGQMMAAMYGGGMQYNMAFVGGLFIGTGGKNADSEIRELIDLVKSGGPKQLSTEIKTAGDLIPNAADMDFIVTYNYLRLFKVLGAMMPMPGPVGMLSKIYVESKSNIVLAGKVAGDRINFELALPKEHLKEIMSAFMAMQQQMTPEQKTPDQPTLSPVD